MLCYFIYWIAKPLIYSKPKAWLFYFDDTDMKDAIFPLQLLGFFLRENIIETFFRKQIIRPREASIPQCYEDESCPHSAHAVNAQGIAKNTFCRHGFTWPEARLNARVWRPMMCLKKLIIQRNKTLNVLIICRHYSKTIHHIWKILQVVTDKSWWPTYV